MSNQASFLDEVNKSNVNFLQGSQKWKISSLTLLSLMAFFSIRGLFMSDIFTAMSTKVLGRLFIQGSRAFQRQTTRQSSDSFDAYRARLDRRMEQIRVLPTAEKDMEWEAPTSDQDSAAATASDGATRKFYDLSLRFGHQVTGLRLRRFKLLATHHSLNVNKWTKCDKCECKTNTENVEWW